MSTHVRVTCAVLTAAIVFGACTLAEDPSPGPVGSAAIGGGTLRVAAYWERLGLGWVGPDGLWDAQLDPQYEYGALYVWELFRCCLLRTLMSYNGLSAERGGSEVRPDLASGSPTVSSDGLTWVFHLKRGLRYAPPLGAVEITAPDVIRAIERMLSSATPAQRRLGYPYLGWNGGTGLASFYLDLIVGARAYLDKASDTIAGLSAPDPHTLQVRLTHPSGDLAYRMSLPVTAPLPPNPYDPAAPLGVAQGHAGGYAPFLVSSGPYMIEGADRVDFSEPAGQRVGASGYTPAATRYPSGRITEPGRLILVRNPSWRRDDLRPAYPDRIEVTLIGRRFVSSTVRQLEAGELAFAMNTNPDSPLNRSRYDPGSPGRVIGGVPQRALLFMFMNTAMPPFDDVDVRRALNHVLDRRTIARLEAGGWDVPQGAAGHIIPDGAEGGLLTAFEPYGPGGSDLVAARTAMARSAYDVDGDGRCDAAACADVPVSASTDLGWNGEAVADQVRADLARIGIGLDVHLGPGCCRRGPAKHPWALVLSNSWVLDYPDAASPMTMLFGSDSWGNFANLGRDHVWLREHGYQVESTPSVDDRIDVCLPMSGSDATRCWAALDVYLMTEVVPFVPIAFVTGSLIVSSEVERVSFDQLTGQPALDRVILTPAPS